MSWAAELGVDRGQPRQPAPRCGCSPPTARARSVVEIGTGTGVSGLWLLRGMRPDGVLTTIDIEPEHQAHGPAVLRRGRLRARPHPADRRRRADVLPRLADDAYDLVFVDGDVTDYPICVGGGPPAAARWAACWW